MSMADSNEHQWAARSRHRTSEGIVVYESCHCGLARIRLIDDQLGGGGRDAPLGGPGAFSPS